MINRNYVNCLGFFRENMVNVMTMRNGWYEDTAEIDTFYCDYIVHQYGDCLVI